MPWLQLSLTVTAAQQPAAEAALEALDALAVTLVDADAQTPDERAIFEPGVGELPLWPKMHLQALFDEGREPVPLIETLTAQVPGIAPQQIEFGLIADQDWTRVWMDQYQPLRFGDRLWVYPWNIEPPPGDDRVVVRLDPGLAFGSGTHPTTALCLRWLDGLDLHDATVIDYGCGSGILAIAALVLGAARAIGIDNDPQALTATRDNAARNGVAERLHVALPDGAAIPAGQGPPYCAEPVDVFVANILAGPLLDLAPRFAALCKPGAAIALSGILDGQQADLLARYADDFESLETAHLDGWVRMTGRRR